MKGDDHLLDRAIWCKSLETHRESRENKELRNAVRFRDPTMMVSTPSRKGIDRADVECIYYITTTSDYPQQTPRVDDAPCRRQALDLPCSRQAQSPFQSPS